MKNKAPKHTNSNTCASDQRQVEDKTMNEDTAKADHRNPAKAPASCAESEGSWSMRSAINNQYQSASFKDATRTTETG